MGKHEVTLGRASQPKSRCYSRNVPRCPRNKAEVTGVGNGVSPGAGPRLWKASVHHCSPLSSATLLANTCQASCGPDLAWRTWGPAEDSACRTPVLLEKWRRNRHTGKDSRETGHENGMVKPWWENPANGL